MLLCFEVAFFAVDLAFVAVFFAVVFALFLATANANFAALALFNPAFSSPALQPLQSLPPYSIQPLEVSLQSPLLRLVVQSNLRP